MLGWSGSASSLHRTGDFAPTLVTITMLCMYWGISVCIDAYALANILVHPHLNDIHSYLCDEASSMHCNAAKFDYSLLSFIYTKVCTHT